MYACGQICQDKVDQVFESLYKPGTVLWGITHVNQDSSWKLPIQIKNSLQAAEDVFTFVTTTVCFDARNEIDDFWNVLSQVDTDNPVFLVDKISIAHKCNSHLFDSIRSIKVTKLYNHSLFPHHIINFIQGKMYV